ncbi:DUF2589 domain-containing protein [Marinilabiliaceae bacterium JC040]|nr:DUF2589 domain-containing protein [Marinilabiliaceae bacterium JC040]
MENKEKGKQISKRSSQVLELQQLIAGPLIATIDADSMSAERYLDFVMHTAFEDYNPETGDTGDLRMLTFSYQSNNLNEKKQQQVKIPLVTLIPLPLLHIEEAEFDFDIKIHDAMHEEEEHGFSIKDGKKVKNENSKPSLKMRASLAPQKGGKKIERDQNLSANMKIHVKMKQADMPAGLSNLLHLTSHNTQIEEIGNKENKSIE